MKSLKTRLVIFDLDGVITSEAAYWQTAREGLAALTGNGDIPQDFIYWVKNHAVNHNWDLAFLALYALRSVGLADFPAFY